MRRIVLGAEKRLYSLRCYATWIGRTATCSSALALLLASASLADEPAAEAQGDKTPQSGVVIRLQLRPSTPQPEIETEAPPDKIPATSVQYKKTSPGADSSQSSHRPNIPVLQRLAQRRTEATKPTLSKPLAAQAGQPQAIAQSPKTPSPQTPSPKTLAPQAVPGPALSTSATPAAKAGASSILSDRTVLELSGQPGPSSKSASTEPAELELSADNKPFGKPEETSGDALSLELQPSLSPSKSSRDSLESQETEAGSLPLEGPDSLTLSGVGSSTRAKPLDLDFSNERPLDSLSDDFQQQLELDDVPVEAEQHPFDAPVAESNPRPAAERPAKLPGSPLESLAPIVKGSQLSADPFTDRERRIEVGIVRCLDYYMTHPENTTRRGPWALMHAALPFGVEGEVLAGNRRVNTIGWLSFNGTSAKQYMFQPTRTGFRPNVGPGMQGHEGQFLAILAQSKVRGDYPLQINGRRYTVMDLAQYEMSTCREKSELTFKLIGLSRYLEPNQSWRDNRGHSWNLEKMVAEELSQPVNGSACGGVHRLMGLSYALIERQAAGQPINGSWQRAEKYLNSYVQYTLTLQNPDGSFSTNWFESRGMDPNVERRVQTSGHILEWLVYTLPEEHLRSPQIQQGMEFLLNTVGREPDKDWPIGPRGHALRAMSLYSQRVFGAEPGQLKSYVAEVPHAASIR